MTIGGFHSVICHPTTLIAFCFVFFTKIYNIFIIRRPGSGLYHAAFSPLILNKRWNLDSISFSESCIGPYWSSSLWLICAVRTHFRTDAALDLNQSQMTKSALWPCAASNPRSGCEISPRSKLQPSEERYIKKKHSLKWSWWEKSHILLQQKSRKTFQQQQRCSNSLDIRHTQVRKKRPKRLTEMTVILDTFGFERLRVPCWAQMMWVGLRVAHLARNKQAGREGGTDRQPLMTEWSRGSQTNSRGSVEHQAEVRVDLFVISH